MLVLMATYNGEQWLDAQIDSVIQQTGVRVSILISDDGSKDATVDMILERCKRDDRIAHLPFGWKGGSAAANFFRILTSLDPSADYDYVALADQDDVWAPDKLSSCIAFGASHPASGNVGLISAATLAFWPDGAEQVLVQSRRVCQYDYLFEGAGQGCTFVLTWACAINVVAAIKEIPLALRKNVHYHDWLIYAFCRRLGYGWAHVPRPLMRYRQHANNDTGAKGSWTAISHRLSKMLNGWYGAQVNAIALCINHVAPLTDGERRLLRMNPKGELAPGWLNGLLRVPTLLSDGRRSTKERVLVAAFSLFGVLVRKAS
ncbi:glycosyltransferase [Pseudaquabacterium rugosum]|uniref:Glycosyltransferase n=1 Tax=Pseudaquabacterium rugosum TaxID=2984194 RepID=A0ABU9B6R2_9BURK